MAKSTAKPVEAEETGGSGWRRITRLWKRPDVRAGSTGQGEAWARADGQPPRLDRWSPIRLDLVQQLFGDGYLAPGGEAAFRAKLEGFDLQPSHRLLHLGGGIGSGTRLAVAEYKLRATTIVNDPNLAEIGSALSVNAGLKRHALVEFGAYDSLVLRPRAFDLALVDEAFLLVRDKAALLDALARALKAGGQLHFDCHCVTGADPHSPEIAIWRAHEPVSVYPTTLTFLRDQCARVGLAGFQAADVTDDHCAAIRGAFAGAVSKLAGVAQDPRRAAWLVAEADFWNRRAAILNSGQVAVQRIGVQLGV